MSLMCNFLTFLILRSMADMSRSASRTLMSYFLSFKKLFNVRDLLLFFPLIFICLWLCWVFDATHRLLVVAAFLFAEHRL